MAGVTKTRAALKARHNNSKEDADRQLYYLISGRRSLTTKDRIVSQSFISKCDEYI